MVVCARVVVQYQGDQIGRIVAFWVIAYFGQLIENLHNSANFCAFVFAIQFMN
jgi:hypothetical protein